MSGTALSRAETPAGGGRGGSTVLTRQPKLSTRQRPPGPDGRSEAEKTMKSEVAKEALEEIIEHVENSKTPSVHGDNLSWIYNKATYKRDLPVDFDDGFARHEIPEDASAIVLDCEDGDVIAEWEYNSGWKIEIEK